MLRYKNVNSVLADFFVQFIVFRPNSIVIGLNNKNWMKGEFMRNFDYSKLAERTWDTDILNLVAKIHECKGR